MSNYLRLISGLFIGIMLAVGSLWTWDDSFNARLHRLHLQGRIEDGRYHGLGDLFSIAMPSKSNTLGIEDFYTAPNVGGVAFFSDSGFFMKLEIDDLIPEVSHLIATYPDIKSEILDALFYDVLLVQLKAKVAGLKVLHERKIQLESGESALFAVLDLPETATLIDLDTGRNLDAKRGLLLFFAPDHKELIHLSLQDTLTLIPTVAEAAKVRLNERLLNHLLQYQSTFSMPSLKS